MKIREWSIGYEKMLSVTDAGNANMYRSAFIEFTQA